MEDNEILLEKINEDIKNVLSEKRYNHSLRVMKKAEELARKFNVDIEKAKIVGLAHDIAKEMTKEEKIEYMNKNNLVVDEIEKQIVELLHGKIGADICMKKYGFTLDMQNAIKYHTTGNPDMDDLAKVILVADKLEEGRESYLDINKIEEIFPKGLNALVVYVLNLSIEYTIKKDSLIHPDSIYTRNRFLLEK